MSMISEFKEFAMRGNVMDMAVGIIIGGAFGKIVSSLVNDIIMPPIGLAMGNVNFADLKHTLGTNKAGEAVTLNYGLFVNTVIDFLIVAIAIFLLIKAINAAKARFEQEKEEEAAAKPSAEVQLLTEIRDSLQK